MASKQVIHLFKKMRTKTMLQINFSLSSMPKHCVSHLASKPVFHKMHENANNVAVIDTNGSYTYGDIMHYSHKLHQRIISNVTKSLSPKNIALMCPNDASYVASLTACWLSGNVAVPLCKDHPLPYLEYFIKDSQSELIIVNKTLSGNIESLTDKLGLPVLEIESPLSKENANSLLGTQTDYVISGRLNDLHNHAAMIIYTSGTTGPPKGVVLTHGNFCSQVSALVEAWGWTSNDTILHALPLYHMHGIMNALLCPLDVGACVVMMPKFDAVPVWEYLLGLHRESRRINMFFGVPTMYNKLLATFEDFAKSKLVSKEQCREICMENVRLMTCGSAALPEPVFLRWEELTGHKLLERYGMSEIGMALSNPLNGPRIPGSVGTPLPDVSACISRTEHSLEDYYVYGDYEKVKCAPEYKGEFGNLLIKGPAVFKAYWNKPDETKDAFTADGWFKTGDTACYENGCFRILGRSSVDIIKSRGYKISALDVERIILSHLDITDCTVIGIPDDVWGEKVVAFIVTKTGNEIPPLDLKAWCTERLPGYCVPSVFKFIAELPRNNMGKVNKKQLKVSYSDKMDI